MKSLQDQAVRALHSGEVDAAFVVDPALREDLHLLMDRWRIVCAVGNSRRGSELVPLEYLELARDLCISLAEQIVEAQRAINTGAAVSPSYGHKKRRVWEQLHDIERKPSPVQITTTES